MKNTIKKIFAILLSIIIIFCFGGCSEQNQDEKARIALVETIDQLLDYEITIAQAKEKLESMYIPTDTALGYAMSRYKDNILTSLKLENLDGLDNTRKILANYDDYKDSDIYYTNFEDGKKETLSTAGIKKYSEFTTSFNELMSALPEYTILQLTDVPLDNGTCHNFTISDTILGDTYRLRIDTDKNEKITWVYLTTDKKTYGNIQFALFSYYAYKSMGFSELDADSFYEKYDLFSKEKIFKNETSNGYELTSMTIDTTNEITFSIKIPE